MIPSYASYQMEPKDIEYLGTLPGNDCCIDCGSDNTEWASVSLGIFFCLECSGKHRALGTHVSFVRSVKMDAWTDVQLQKMKQGGNQRCRDFLKSHGINMSYCMVNGGSGSGNSDSTTTTTTTALKDRYDTPAAALYQQVLKARVAGEPEPTELPPPRPIKVNKPMTGFGSSPSPLHLKHAEKTAAASRRRTAMAGALSGAALVAWSIVRRRSQTQREL